ncbi:MAG: alpha-2-macroglobulin family protein [Candidatus Taylorbacteria bacterium]
MNKKYYVGVVVVLLLALVYGFTSGFFVNLLKNPFHNPAPNYQAAYRLVPDKVSKSAAVMVSLPSTINVQNFDPSKQISFEPVIQGRWVVSNSISIIPVAYAAESYKTYYFQPDAALELNKHYAVALSLPGGQMIRSDFLTVADPSIISILPHDSEVMSNTKISIVFNRPMVPLTTIDETKQQDPPVVITPKTAGHFKWISTNTLQFIPDSGLISSANYTVSTKFGFKSSEGIEVAPYSTKFSTYHLQYWKDDERENGGGLPVSAVRGYNQPFLVRFNQAVDLVSTQQYITVNNGERNIGFTLKYGQTDGKEDNSLMAIYPSAIEGGSWELQHDYTVSISRAYPASHGDIILDSPITLNYSVNNIYSNITVLSPRTNDASLDRFDPKGQISIRFYEGIDLNGSSISGTGVASVVYGEKCRDENNIKCTKIADQSVVLISFKPDNFKPGDTTQVLLNKIVSTNGTLLNTKSLPIDLKVYQPLVIYSVRVTSYLNSITVCSNNPLQIDDTKPVIDSTPVFNVISWTHSFRSSVNAYRAVNQCNDDQFSTPVSGYLLPQSMYKLKMSATDVFGNSASGTYDFKTRAVESQDYELRNYQDIDTVTVPGKTKLTFKETFLPEITAKVCKLSPYDYYRVRNDVKLNANDHCQASVIKNIKLPTDKPGSVLFTIDIKDYFPEQIGNYVVLLSSPVLPTSERNSWQYATVSYISVTNLVVTQKSINPKTERNSGGIALRTDQLNKLQNLYWVIDAVTQSGVAGASVQIYKDGVVVARAITNNEGVAALAPVVDAQFTVVSLGNDSVVMSSYTTKLNYASEVLNVEKMFLYSDKPLYRPGQSVNIKGIYKAGYDGYYESASNKPVTLIIRDASYTEIKQVSLVPNSYGSISTVLNLESSVTLGTYSACVDYQCVRFDVLDYVPAAFKVDIEASKDELIKSDNIEANVKANYYFGVPVASATGKYNVSSQYYYFNKYTKEYFNFNNIVSNDIEEGYYYGDSYITGGNIVLDKDGQATIKPDLGLLRASLANSSKIIIIDATVKNQQGRSVSAQNSFVVHAADTYIGSKIVEPFVSNNDTVSVRLKTVDTEANPRSLEVKVNLYHQYWTSKKNGNGNLIWEQNRDLVNSFNASTDANGDGEISLPKQKEGEYTVDVVSRGSGAAVGSRSYFYVYGYQSVSIRGSDDTSLDLVMSNTKLNSGGTGEVLIKMPEGKGKALITIERGKVFTYKVIDISGTLTKFQFPINAEYYPNVYISVTAYAPNRAVRFGSENITVNSDEKKLNLSIVADKQNYNPGDKVTLQLRSTDMNGEPKATDLSLAVVDMSVLALRGNPKKDPLDYFYGNIDLTVSTDSNYKSLLKEVEWKNNDGKGGSGGDATGQKSRGVFKEVAYWNPDIITDRSGNASITFTLPDNLTTWQAEMIGITSDVLLGAAYKEFTTNKDLMIVPLKPRFILPGDSFSLGATVFNHSKDNFNGTISLKTPSNIDTSKTSLVQSLGLKPGESKDVYFDVSVPDTTATGELSYSITAKGGTLTDAIEDSIKINENNSYEVTATAGMSSTQATETVYIPRTVVSDKGELSVRSSATLAIYLPQAIKYMLDYSYDCTEQIASQIQVLALLKKANLIAGVDKIDNTTKLSFKGRQMTADEIIKEDLQSIYNRQVVVGGFKLWSQDYEPSIFATLKAIEAFLTLNNAGYTVDQNVWETGAKYLYDQYYLSQNTFSDADTVNIASALFTRSSYVNNQRFLSDFYATVNKILRQDKVPTDILITLSHISHRYGLVIDQVKKIDSLLENRMIVDSRGSFLDTSINDYYSTSISNTARYVELLSMNKQNNVELPNLLRWLYLGRSKDGAWGSTRNTLAVVSGFVKYLEWKNETNASFTETNSLNGAVIDQWDYTPANILTVLAKTIPLHQLKTDAINTITFAKSADTNTSKGNIYYDLGFKYYLPANSMSPRDEGFVIERGFYALSDTKMEKPLNIANVGDVVTEHIEITVPVTRNAVSIEDFIPAGMEIVDTSLDTEDKTLINNSEVRISTLLPDHQEWKDDRAFLYRENLSPGTYTFDYKVRALIPGTYLRLPAQISEMYTPENFGRTGASLFIINK